jgi:hypothetical protein
MGKFGSKIIRNPKFEEGGKIDIKEYPEYVLCYVNC